MGAKASSPQAASKSDPRPGDKGHAQVDATPAKKTGHVVEIPVSNDPEPKIYLATGRFATKIILSLGVFVGVLGAFALGVTIDGNVRDPLGSSTNVDRWVKWYQTANGFVSSGISSVFQGYLSVFIVVATTFLRNRSLYPGDNPSAGPSRVKRLLLWLFCPAVMYNVHVAVTAMYVSHKTTGVARIFLPEDLLASRGALETTVLNTTTAMNFTSTGNNVSVLDTILRGAVLQKVDPFKLDPKSPCLLVNTTAGEPRAELPTVKEASSTAVVYGFPTRYWNVDALPFGLVPDGNFTFNLKNGTVSDEAKQSFLEFQQQWNVTWSTVYESFLQGKLLFERSVSDADASKDYPCVLSDNNTELDIDDPDYDWQHFFFEGPYEGKRRCFGAISTLRDLGNITDPAAQTVDAFLSKVVHGFAITAPQIDTESASLAIEVHEINPQLKLTSMTFDMPYHANFQYRDTSELCNGSELRANSLVSYMKKKTKVATETLRKRLCDNDQYAYVNSRAACGHSNCIFRDQSETIPFKRQLQLMPYMANCSTTELTYDSEYLNFFPSGCEPIQDAVFLYGLGSYMTGDEFDSGSQMGFPFISNPRRHITVTFAKLEWTFVNISDKFGAECGVNATEQPSQCFGLLYSLENVTVAAINVKEDDDVYKRVLVLGQGQIPGDLKEANYRTPVQLLSLNSRRFFYPLAGVFYEWEYLNLKHFKSTDWPEINRHSGLDGKLCSPLVDSYISTLETNNYHMDNPLQPLYTAALFYLFQDAAVKTVKVWKTDGTDRGGRSTLFDDSSVEGYTTLKGDMVEHIIMLKITWQSLVLTFTGLVLLRVLAVIAMVTPIQRMRKTNDADENVARQYARLRHEDKYPSTVFDRGLQMRTGIRRSMDSYVVERLTLHHKDNTKKKIYL